MVIHGVVYWVGMERLSLWERMLVGQYFYRYHFASEFYTQIISFNLTLLNVQVWTFASASARTQAERESPTVTRLVL
jgi:hypothetical protein